MIFIFCVEWLKDPTELRGVTMQSLISASCTSIRTQRLALILQAGFKTEDLSCILQLAVMGFIFVRTRCKVNIRTKTGDHRLLIITPWANKTVFSPEKIQKV